MYHVGCAISLHSIISSGLIPGDQSLSNRQTVFFLVLDHKEKMLKDLDVIDWNVPRCAQHLHRLNEKEVIFPKEEDEFIFRIEDGRIKTLEEIKI